MFCAALIFSAFCFAETEPIADGDFVITVGDFSCRLGDMAAPLIKAAEKNLNVTLEMTETDSCMFDGMDREYTCDSLLIGTHPSGPRGEDRLESLLVFDGSLSTARGITVGMNKDDVLAAYGESGFEDWDELIFSDAASGASVTFVLDLDTDTVTCWMLLRNTDRP